MIKRYRNLACLLFLIASQVFAADASERKFIREGMTEGEVMTKVGKPDSETLDSGPAAAVVVKRWTYMPAAGDEQTMTTVVLRGGTVAEVTRQLTR